MANDVQPGPASGELFSELSLRKGQRVDAANGFAEPPPGSTERGIGLMFVETDHHVAAIDELRLFD